MIDTAHRVPPAPLPGPGSRAPAAVWVGRLLLALAAVLYALHFVHLNADFPNHSPWVDWSKYTDEGWYGDAAIRHYMTGHWYWRGDFNPAVALPVWPAVELVWFRFAGVGLVSARALTLLVFGVALLAFYRLIGRHTRPHSGRSGPPLAAPLAVLFLCANPLLFVFERMAILEPMLIALTALALLAASHLHPLRALPPAALRRHPGPELVEGQGTPRPAAAGMIWVFGQRMLPTLALTLLLPALVLTKTTAICLFPAVFYMVWARGGYRIRPALALAAPPVLGGLALWCAYFFLFVRPRYLADYTYLFSANAYTGIELEPLARVVLNTLADGNWMGTPLYLALFAAVALAIFWRPHLFTNPLVPSLLLWTAGYFAFLAYHNNLQPRYYTVATAPAAALVALAIDALRHPFADRPGPAGLLANALAAIAALVIAVPGIVLQAGFLLHPTYDFQNAALAIRRIVLADRQHPHLILSISGSDLTLMTGLPSIDDDFGTLELTDRVKLYRPGWYVAWNELDDDKADSLTPFYTVNRVAAFPAYDDPDRNLLILYRLDPARPAPAPAHPRPRTPRPLVTRLGQQPSVPQLVH
jgi:hypothetical protein